MYTVGGVYNIIAFLSWGLGRVIYKREILASSWLKTHILMSTDAINKIPKPPVYRCTTRRASGQRRFFLFLSSPFYFVHKRISCCHVASAQQIETSHTFLLKSWIYLEDDSEEESQNALFYLFEGETDDFGSGLFLMSALHSKNNFDGKSSFRQIL